MSKQTKIVIRHCTGNTAAWGAFIDNANLWCMGTAMSVDGLLHLLESRYPGKSYRGTWKIQLVAS